MANVYAPLYNSLQARGRMSPLGAPGAIKPEKKKKGLGDKMASALGSMMDQALEGDDKKRVSQLLLRNEDLKKQENVWEISPTWTQDNYEWEAHGRPNEGIVASHKRHAEYKKNLDEIKNIQVEKHMSEFDKEDQSPSMIESLINGFVKG